jgi:hypothetical protein
MPQCFQSALLRYAAGRKLDLSGSRATRGNIDATLSVNGATIEREAA